MSHVFLQREWPEPIDVPAIKEMFDESLECFGIHRIDWEESFLSADGRRLFCHFTAPDAESVRLALRELEADRHLHWPGTVHDAADVTQDEILRANVIVHRSFAEPVQLQDLQAIEDANVHCLHNHRVRFMRTFFSLDRRRMACLYTAPDAESVRIAQRQATMPLDAVRACRRVTNDSF